MSGASGDRRQCVTCEHWVSATELEVCGFCGLQDVCRNCFFPLPFSQDKRCVGCAVPFCECGWWESKAGTVVKIEQGYKFSYQCPDCGSALLFAQVSLGRLPLSLLEKQQQRKGLPEEKDRIETPKEQERRRLWNVLLEGINFDSI